MSVKKILVPLADRPSDNEVLGTALSIAGDFGAQIVALFARPDPTEALPYLGDGVSGQVIEDLLQAAREGADDASARVLQMLNEAASKSAFRSSARAPNRRCRRSAFSTSPAAATKSSPITAASPISLCSVKAPPAFASGTALEAAMMSAGRPVLIAPKKSWAPVGGSVAIAWDESAEAARAVTAAIPFLEKARKVTILCIGDKELNPDPGSTLADYLALHGVVADVHLVDARGRAARRGAARNGGEGQDRSSGHGRLLVTAACSNSSSAV